MLVQRAANQKWMPLLTLLAEYKKEKEDENEIN